jgi:hypothetical protein
MNKLILILCAIISLAACNDFVEYDIPQDQIPIYKTNDTVVFRDYNNNLNDTFSLYVFKTFWKSDHSTYYYYSSTYSLLKNKTKKEYMSTTQNINSMSFAIVNSDFNGVFSSTIANYSQNGIIYPSAFYANMKYIPDSIPNAVYYTYKYGVLRYEYKNGRIYELIRR